MALHEKTRTNGHKLSYGKFHLDVIKNFFTVEEVKHWSRLPRAVVVFFRGDIQNQAEEVLRNLL